MPRRALLLAVLLLPAAALARPTLALRLAFAPSFFDAADRVPMSDVMKSQLPIQLDALWRLGPVFAAGGYVSWGVGQPGATGCGSGCSASAVRAGIQALWSPATVVAKGAPWLGAGAGWEWATTRREQLGSEISYRWSGPEGLVQAGVEWKVGGKLALGPFLLVALGSYGDLTLETPVASSSAGIHDRTVHGWIQLGVRGRIDL